MTADARYGRGNPFPQRGSLDHRDFYLGEIASITGSTPEQLDPTELADFYVSLYRNGNHSRRLLSDDISGPDRTALEQRIGILVEGLLGLKPIFSSFGRGAPTYIPLLREYRETTSSDEHESSLMVGAFPHGIAEFATITRTVFPDAKCTVLDIEPRQNARFAEEAGVEFVQGSALKMPFADNSFDVVHFDFLFNFLRDGNPAGTEQFGMQWFQNLAIAIAEANRVLKPGGILVIQDSLIPTFVGQTLEALDEQGKAAVAGDFLRSYFSVIFSSLQKSGFENIQPGTPQVFADADGYDRYVRFGDFDEMPPEATKTAVERMIFVAQKPKSEGK